MLGKAGMTPDFVLIHHIFHGWVSKQLMGWPSLFLVFMAAKRLGCWFTAYGTGHSFCSLRLEPAIAWHRNTTRHHVLEWGRVQKTLCERPKIHWDPQRRERSLFLLPFLLIKFLFSGILVIYFLTEQFQNLPYQALGLTVTSSIFSL